MTDKKVELTQEQIKQAFIKAFFIDDGSDLDGSPVVSKVNWEYWHKRLVRYLLVQEE